MGKKHSYRAIDVERIDVAKLIPLLAMDCVLAIDAAKTKIKPARHASHLGFLVGMV